MITSPSACEARKRPLGPSGHVLHGNTPEFTRGRLAFLERMAREYGDVVRYRLGCDVTYLVNDPRLCRAIFSDWEHVDNALTNGWMFLDQSYLAVHGRGRARPRALVHGAICPRAILARDDRMTACVLRMLSGFRDGEALNVLDALMRVGVEMLSVALVGLPAEAWMQPVFGYLSDIQTLGGAYTDSPELSARLDLAGRREVFETLEATVTDFVEGLADEEHEEVPVLAALLRAKRAGLLSARGLVHELCVLLLSNGSTSLLATSALYALARHPETLVKAERELAQVLGGRTPAAADLGRLTYLDLVVRETLRLYPPVALIPRLVVADFDCGPYRFEAGAQIHVSPHLLHRHPRYWQDPERFWPERFDAKEGAPANPAFMPFGHAIRRCIGDQLAMLQVKLLLATLLPRVRLAPVPGFALTYDVSPMGASYPTDVSMPMIVQRRPLGEGA